MKRRLCFGIFLTFVFTVPLLAAEPIVIGKDGLHSEHFFHGQFLDLLEDKSGKLQLQDILGVPYQNRFKQDTIIVSGRYLLNTYYWAKFTVRNNSSRKDGWVIELYDFKTDYFELYLPGPNGTFSKKTGGDQFRFDQREYLHKNFVYNLAQLPTGGEQTFYLKIYSESPINIIGVIRTQERFLHYATMEYYLLALFYGVLCTIGLYNLLLYFNVREEAYLFLAVYIFGFAVYCMCQDGTGFQFFWKITPC